jgi:hypothetical protein
MDRVTAEYVLEVAAAAAAFGRAPPGRHDPTLGTRDASLGERVSAADAATRAVRRLLRTRRAGHRQATATEPKTRDRRRTRASADAPRAHYRRAGRAGTEVLKPLRPPPGWMPSCSMPRHRSPRANATRLSASRLPAAHSRLETAPLQSNLREFGDPCGARECFRFDRSLHLTRARGER